MTRNLKALGLALMAMCALGAVVVSAASAQTNGKITSVGNPAPAVTLTGEETGVNKNFLKAFGTEVSCPGSTYTGHLVALPAGQLIPSGSSTATLTPHYKQTEASGTANCNASNGTSVTVDTNGCDFVAHLGLTTGGADEYGVTFDVVCPTGQQITVTFFATHNHTTPVCKVDVGPTGNQGLSGADAVDTNTGDGHIELTGTVKNITATKTFTGVLCPEETTNTAEFSIDATVKADNELGKPVAISLSH